MDPGEPGERCLPEMGLSGWMKRTMERSYDLSDFCTSPPADGFYYSHLQKGNNAGVAGKGNCSASTLQQADLPRKEESRTCSVMGGVLSINQPSNRPLISQALAGADMSFYQQQHQLASVNNLAPSVCPVVAGGEVLSMVSPDYGKPGMPGYQGHISKHMSLGLNNQSGVGTPSDSPTGSEDGKDLQRIAAEERQNWTNNTAGVDMEVFNGQNEEMTHSTDDSAPTPVDHLVSRYTPTIVTPGSEEGGSLGLVEKLGRVQGSCPATPDVTPCTTPAVTPVCSPQAARRAGNPFFTGGVDTGNQSGSWLFRPGKKATDIGGGQSDKLYETMVEFQQNPNSKTTKKTIRYVPRPSELRELNFWSPTSM